MVVLEKDEQKLYELPFKKRLLLKNKLEVKRLILTNKYIRVQYCTHAYVKNKFKKIKEQLFIDLNSIIIQDYYPAIFYKEKLKRVILQISFNDSNLEIELKCKRKKRKCIKKINEFIKKTCEAVENLIDYKIASIEPTINFVETEMVKEFLIRLGQSKTELSARTINKLRTEFPIPKEHNIIWANCKFDKICSGIVFTQKGVFIKNIVLDENGKIIDVPFHFWRYEYIDSKFYELNSEEIISSNLDEIIISYASSNSHSEAFKNEEEALVQNNYFLYKDVLDRSIDRVIEFILDHRKQRNRHGYYANNNHNTQNDKTVGINNKKNRYDRQVRKFLRKNELIQTKCCKSYKETVDSLFENNNFRYIENDKFMQCEVPQDQYDDAVNYLSCLMLKKENCDKLKDIQLKHNEAKRFKKVELINNIGGIDFTKYKNLTDKNFNNKELNINLNVDNVINDDETLYIKNKENLENNIKIVKEKAECILVRSPYTYKQYVNMSKAGNIESLKFDAINSSVVFYSVFPRTFVVNVATNYRHSKDLQESIKVSFVSAGQASVSAFAKKMLYAQFYKTNLPKTLNVEDPKALKDSPVDWVFTIATLSIPNIVETFRKNITYGQLMKNTLILTGGVVGGVVGSKIGKAVGSKILWGIGSFFGAIIGGLIGQKQGAKLAKSKADEIREDDIVIFSRLYYAYAEMLVVDYVMDENEINKLYEILSKVKAEDLVRLNRQYLNHDCSDKYLISYLTRKIKRIVSNRPHISDYDIIDSIATIQEK